MKINIAENIRKYRKARGMTQERLAEALGVTVGAVSKWESGASMPDISLIVEMAGFFETSVDVLLDYGWCSGSMKDAIANIKALRNEKRFEEASVEAEKALERYPNSFDVSFGCAIMYSMKGVESGSKKAYQRALLLFERSLTLIEQNTNMEISEWSIRNSIAEIYLSLGQADKAIEQLKRNNVNGLNNEAIGRIIATHKHEPDEALRYLSDACISSVTGLIRMVTGYINAYDQKRNSSAQLAVSEWLLGIVEGLKQPGKISYMDKVSVQFLAGCAAIADAAGDAEGARQYLKRAMEQARRFDAQPSYGFTDMRFYHGDGSMTAFDDFGTTAEAGIEQTLRTESDASEQLLTIWEELRNE